LLGYVCAWAPAASAHTLRGAAKNKRNHDRRLVMSNSFDPGA
jgi:hypothetical protein